MPVSPLRLSWRSSERVLPLSKIRQLARDMANIDGAVCYGRMGVSVQVYGTLCQWAIHMINILTGSLDVRGGMMASSPALGYVKPGESGAGHFAAFHSRVSGLPEFAGELPLVLWPKRC